MLAWNWGLEYRKQTATTMKNETIDDVLSAVQQYAGYSGHSVHDKKVRKKKGGNTTMQQGRELCLLCKSFLCSSLSFLNNYTLLYFKRSHIRDITQ